MAPVDRLLRLLLVSLEGDDATAFLEWVRVNGYSCEFSKMESFAPPEDCSFLSYDIVLWGHSTEHPEGLAGIGLLRKLGYSGLVMVVSKATGEEVAVQAIKAGADEFLSPSGWQRFGSILAKEFGGKARGVPSEHHNFGALRQIKSEALSRVAGTIAHSFNNALTVLMGNLTLLQGSSALAPDSVGFVSSAEKACRKVGTLTQSLFQLGRGRVPKVESFFLHGLLERTVREVDPGLPWNFNLAPAFPDLEVQSDPQMLASIVGHLLKNAVHAMPNGGEITITSELLLIRCGESLGLPPGPYVQVTVSDAGEGISSLIEETLFEPFVTTRKGADGLGLALSLTAVRKLGGHLTYFPLSSGGTRFVVLVPRQIADTQAVELPLPAPRTLSGRVLIMDDESSIRDLLGMALKEIGFEVGLAGDGVEAIRLARVALEERRPFSVAVLDLSIPGGMGGSETLQALRTIDPSIRAIVSSGMSDHQILEEHRKVGFDAAIAKPYDLDEMFRLIEKLGRNAREN